MTKELVTAAVSGTTVNYHLLRPGNMGCGYCYAPFPDLPSKNSPS